MKNKQTVVERFCILGYNMFIRFYLVCCFTTALAVLFLFPYTVRSDNSKDISVESFGKPLSAKESSDIAKKLKDTQKSINAVSATIHQKKRDSTHQTETDSKGTVTIKKPNFLYLEIEKPERRITIIEGKTMWVYQPDLKEARKYILTEQLSAMQTMSFFFSAINISFNDIEKKFDISAYNLDGKYLFEMKPKSGLISRYLTAITILYEKGEAVPSKFEIIGKKGDTAITEFSDVVINPSIKESLFNFIAPSGVNVITIGNESPSY